MIPAPHYPDLALYSSERDEMLGLQPRTVGWLHRKKSFLTAPPGPKFISKLAAFCRPENRVFEFKPRLRCVVDNHLVEPFEVDGLTFELGHGEIRVMGDEDIFAAPDLILHYVMVHHYEPPHEFISAVLNGPPPHSAEFRALLRALQ